MMKRISAILGAVIVVGACSSSAKPPRDVSSDANEKLASGESATIGALEQSNLPRGACGMILWTLDSDRPTAVFRFVAGKAAEMVIDGDLREFALVETQGRSGFGVSETQKFSDDDLTLSARFSFGQGFDGGSYLERSIITIERENGWRTVIPAAGVAGCRPK